MNFSKSGILISAVSICVLLCGCETMSSNLYDAAQQDDMPAVQRLVSQGQDVNAPGDFNQTPLYQAAVNGNVEMVRLLLDHGAKTDVMVLGMVPLTGAVWKGYTEVVRLLVQRGANVNVVSNWGTRFTPLLYCGAYGNAEIARILIDAGADVNARDTKGKTVVDYAKEYKKDEVLAVLRKAGAAVSYTGNAAKDIVMAALSADREKVRSLVEEGANPNTKDKSGKSLLSYAVENKWPEIVELLIKKGADANVKDSDGWTLVMKAALDNQTEMLRAFENSGIKMSYTGNNKDDLLTAVLSGDREKVAVLLSEGTIADSTYRFKSPILNYALLKGDREIVKLLIDHKANPNLANTNGISPFIAALKSGDVQSARLLLEHGADVNAKDAENWTALLYAIRTGSTQLVKDMLAKGAQPDMYAVILSEGRNPDFKKVNFPEITALLKPEVLRRQMLRAEAAVEAAQSPDDYSKAIQEYELAGQISPGSPEIYYNLGLIQDKAGRYAEAIASLRKYLELAPGSSDAQAVKDMIYKIEYKSDRSR